MYKGCACLMKDITCYVHKGYIISFETFASFNCAAKQHQQSRQPAGLVICTNQQVKYARWQKTSEAHFFSITSVDYCRRKVILNKQATWRMWTWLGQVRFSDQNTLKITRSHSKARVWSVQRFVLNLGNFDHTFLKTVFSNTSISWSTRTIFCKLQSLRLKFIFALNRSLISESQTLHKHQLNS